MEQSRFDALTQWLTHGPSRRDVLRGLTAAGLGLGSLRLPDLAEAKRKGKRKKKRKTITRNAFGCVDVGKFCKNGGQCCSGICTGKKGKNLQTCKAHDVGDCQAADDACGVDLAPCTRSDGAPGQCTRTTGKASICGTGGGCRECRKDTDCEGECGPGAACIVCEGVCGPGGTACVSARAESCPFTPSGRRASDDERSAAQVRGHQPE